VFMEIYFIKFHQKIAFGDFRVTWPSSESVTHQLSQTKTRSYSKHFVDFAHMDCVLCDI